MWEIILIKLFTQKISVIVVLGVIDTCSQSGHSRSQETHSVGEVLRQGLMGQGVDAGVTLLSAGSCHLSFNMSVMTFCTEGSTPQLDFF